MRPSLLLPTYLMPRSRTCSGSAMRLLILTALKLSAGCHPIRITTLVSLVHPESFVFKQGQMRTAPSRPQGRVSIPDCITSNIPRPQKQRGCAHSLFISVLRMQGRFLSYVCGFPLAGFGVDAPTARLAAQTRAVRRRGRCGPGADRRARSR